MDPGQDARGRFRHARPRLLVVDDDPLLLEAIGAVLELDYRVTTCVDPVEALERVRQGSFDLYLYDLCMESITGTELLMLTLAQSGDVPVLLMTGDPSIEGAVGALRAGAEDFLLKPLDFQHLGQALEKALRKHQESPHAPGKLAVVHEALIRAVEAKDPTTSGHAERVRALCETIADEMGLPADERDVLSQAALLHDIGKIGVPDEILAKPGKLTAEEFAKIQEHPEVGARILEPLPGTSEIRRCILEHHEKWDGTGYPNGLRGDEVSQTGRVLILVEVFDALAHARSYKAAWPRDKIRSYFKEMAGKHFDPELVPIFDSLLALRFEEFVQPLGPLRQCRGA